jgi:hypothetical protein
VIAFIPPGTQLAQPNNVIVRTFDAKEADLSELVKGLEGEMRL